jgi:N-acetylglucosaminyldiphosphoundecaprenol N-acetyl-beta-D-mannosaminyltransferase
MRVSLEEFAVDCIPMNEVVDLLIDRIGSKMRTRIVTLNPETVMQARQSAALYETICGADLVVPDGTGIVFALRSRGFRTERIAGIDLAYLLMARLSSANGRVFLLGGAPGVAAAAGARLARELPGLQIVGTHDGYFSAEHETMVLTKIRKAHPDLLVVGMGTPRQELWLARYWRSLEVTVGIGVGGSIDIWAGRLQRAPMIMRRMGLEWLYRVWIQPQRWPRVIKSVGFITAAVINGRRRRVREDG